MNRYTNHLYVIPEDDRDRQIAVGFVEQSRIKHRQIRVMPVAGGWANVLQVFKEEYIHKLRENQLAHLVMLIDFDGRFDDRWNRFNDEIPADLKERVFVLGPSETPEALKNAVEKSYEKIGVELADECDVGTFLLWTHEHLQHNDPELQRLREIVRPFLF